MILKQKGIAPKIIYKPLKPCIMNALKNSVQLIGNLGQDPEIVQLENGTKLAKFSLATNDSYKNEKGDRVERTEWHNVVAWGKVADIIEIYTTKGKMIALQGKLRTSSYEDKDGIKRRNTEIVLNEVLLLGEK